MLLCIPDVLTHQELETCRAELGASSWVDGKVTAGAQSAAAKHNLQIPETDPVARKLGDLVLRALGRNAEFNAAALPLRVFPPLFNRYDADMRFDAHIDNALRFVPGANIRMRTDVSSTLFLSDLADYDGGELVIEEASGARSIKLPAGHMVLYPATSLHRVAPITRGSRWASFFWTQSLVKDNGQRTELYRLDRAITEVRARLGDHDHTTLALTGTYHNLLRRWSEL